MSKRNTPVSLIVFENSNSGERKVINCSRYEQLQFRKYFITDIRNVSEIFRVIFPDLKILV